jgi:DNA-binding transcriptional regulator GbsR (MarR family)
MVPPPSLRVLTPEGDLHRFTEACFALSSGTRVEVLNTLLLAQQPLHIREIARRVKSDPSPVRSHLDLLVKLGFARELPEPGRERRFVADVSALRLVLAPPTRPADVDPKKEPSRAIRRIDERMKDLEEKMHRVERELAKLGEERAALWRKGD